ncbi:unnamed protein product [Darwinula stevensoni]|uniref:Uncharacterized protein n=1 Tax=Darwinula stevensoni TaxID=69355 RepID=A0A7R8XEQ4_9CRUS|nr:unnamed protein product [Darwinula stevensoni]CAG0894689.1 unnamed protein product [Darwinula stevensoni]
MEEERKHRAKESSFSYYRQIECQWSAMNNQEIHQNLSPERNYLVDEEYAWRKILDGLRIHDCIFCPFSHGMLLFGHRHQQFANLPMTNGTDGAIVAPYTVGCQCIEISVVSGIPVHFDGMCHGTPSSAWSQLQNLPNMKEILLPLCAEPL